MNKKLRLEIFAFLDKLPIPMTATNYAKYVKNTFCLTWDDSKKAVATWDRQRAK